MEYLEGFSIGFAFIAAASWFYSAIVRIKPVEGERDEQGMEPMVIVKDGADLFKSLRAQSCWSAIAASCAGGAAVLQGIALMFK